MDGGAVRSNQGEARAAAERYFERWTLDMWDARGCLDALTGLNGVREERLPTVWFEDWASECAPTSMDEASIEAMRGPFIDEAELLIETYDGPQPWAAGW